MSVGFPIAIPLRPTVLELRGTARNYAPLGAIVRSLQGSQLRPSEIQLRWKP